MLEALLYGASGLLQTRSDRFGYIKTLRLHFSHLSNKYDIMPLKAGAWLLHSGAFKGRPVTRLMQTAALLKDDNFLFDNVIEVRELSQIYKIFSAETSAFWRDDPDIPQRIGKDRQEVLAINMLVPLLFAYYKSIKQEDDMEAAIDLLYKIPAEKNILANPWRKKGMKVENSADTQALIQLKKFYCNFKKCADCRFGKEIIRMKIKEKSK